MAVSDKGSHCLDVLNIVINILGEGNADSYRVTGLAQFLEVSKDQVVGDAGQPFVSCAVHVFDIIKKQLCMLGCVQQGCRRRKAAGIDDPVEAQQGEEGLRLAKGFTARTGYAAAALVKKRQILGEFGNDLGDTHLFAGRFVGKGRADSDAGATGSTPLFGTIDTLVSQAEGTFRAEGNAFAAADTFRRQVKELRVEVDTFRVVAPLTGERTTFEKDCCSDIWAIMQGIAFDGKNVGKNGLHGAI